MCRISIPNSYRQISSQEQTKELPASNLPHCCLNLPSTFFPGMETLFFRRKVTWQRLIDRKLRPLSRRLRVWMCLGRPGVTMIYHVQNVSDVSNCGKHRTRSPTSFSHDHRLPDVSSHVLILYANCSSPTSLKHTCIQRLQTKSYGILGYSCAWVMESLKAARGFDHLGEIKKDASIIIPYALLHTAAVLPHGAMQCPAEVTHFFCMFCIVVCAFQTDAPHLKRIDAGFCLVICDKKIWGGGLTDRYFGATTPYPSFLKYYTVRNEAVPFG